MLVAFLPQGTSLERKVVPEGESIPQQAVWLDVISPSAEDDRCVEASFGISLPTREEMAEIEPSSRLYSEDGVRYMTATLICQADTPSPATTVVTFILGGGRLITVRHDEPRPFAMLASRLGRHCAAGINGDSVLIELLDTIIDRAADILERTGGEIDRLSQTIFEHKASFDGPEHTYKEILKTIGKQGDLTSKVRESLVSIGRLVLFLANEAEGLKLRKEQRSLVKSMARDVTSLTDHADFVANKIIFLLDATLGMVNIDQTNVIKIFSVVAVVLLPPTMVASIYGMNFDYMPELHWTFGYPLALFMMLLSSILPYQFFKWKGWL